MSNTSKRYRWTPAQKDQMKALYGEGYSIEDVAILLGCSRETIRYHLKKSGTDLRGVGMQTDIAKAKYSGEKHHGWRGGRSKDHGYVRRLFPEHPHADESGYIPEHRYVMEQHLLANHNDHPALVDGILSKKWVVHHKNGKKDDNRLSNLEVLPRERHHSWIHYKEEMERLRRENKKLRKLLHDNGISL